ncbi:hypothetical protein SAMN05444161_5044 [Rhizobiales bacterium GAS191]|nr:hypothetical protein SAMN05444161_5044 [Rhizobiales bacterium GAS191]
MQSSSVEKAKFPEASTLSFDLDRALRIIKPQRRSSQLARRPDAELNWAAKELPIGGPLMLDTTVYLDVLSGRTPAEVDKLLTYRICDHSAICLAELTHAFGRLDPEHRDTKAALKVIRETVEDVPAHRIRMADVDVWGMAGILAGTAFRLSGLPPKLGHERKLLNDALIYLQALKFGCAVLTANIRDFDLLNQLMPSGRLIFYKRI